MGLPGEPRARCQPVPQLLRAVRECSRIQMLHTRQRGPFPRKTGCWWRGRQPCALPPMPLPGAAAEGNPHNKPPLPKKRPETSSLLHSPEPEHRSSMWMFCALQKAFIHGMRYTGFCRSWLLWEWAAGLESLAWFPWSGKSPEGFLRRESGLCHSHLGAPSPADSCCCQGVISQLSSNIPC